MEYGTGAGAATHPTSQPSLVAPIFEMIDVGEEILAIAETDYEFAMMSWSKSIAVQAQQEAADALQQFNSAMSALQIATESGVFQPDPQDVLLARDIINKRIGEASWLQQEATALIPKCPAEKDVPRTPAQEEEKNKEVVKKIAKKKADRTFLGRIWNHVVDYKMFYIPGAVLLGFVIGNKMKWWSPPKWTPKLLK